MITNLYKPSSAPERIPLAMGYRSTNRPSSSPIIMFYLNVWETIGDKFTGAALDILNNDGPLEEWNSTVITLIPKTKESTLMKDFRPISLCNVSYKIIVRTITNKLKLILGDIINPHQSAFVPGRAIADNIIIDFECMHWLRNSNRKHGYAALKMDMSKAYDRVKWTYLREILIALGFNDRWTALILKYVTSVSYAFKINGNIVGKVQPTRGLRQGDPLSPYLFVLCSQGLSTILNNKASTHEIQGIKLARGSPAITYLFFADDRLIFFKADKKNCDSVKNCLNVFEKASGQQINFEKLAITFSKHTPHHQILYIKNSLQLSIFHGHEVYLGLPTFTVWSKRL